MNLKFFSSVLRIHFTFSSTYNARPKDFTFQNLDITSYEGARCWNPGWGSSSINGAWASSLESIGVNLLGKRSCRIRSLWDNLYDNEICAVSAPTDATEINGYGYHVVSGAKETCSGDYGSPLLCDIDGVNTLVGINSRGYDECATDGYPAIHLSMNSIQTWINDVITNESGRIIWSEWSRCDSDCKQTRQRKYESEMRDCKNVCFKNAPDSIDETLRICTIDHDRRKRSLKSESRIMGGQNVEPASMPYVVKLKFQENYSDNQQFSQQCVGTIIHKFFIATSRYCCSSGDFVTISFQEVTTESIQSNTFYLHSTVNSKLDSCLIRVEADLSQKTNRIPCLPNNVDINNYNGAACWNAGWGTVEIDGAYSDELESIGINLMSKDYCVDHSFWETEQIKDGYMCAGSPPNDSSPMTGWKHVTAGGKGTCQGDFGAPLICDIDGVATYIGINSDGDLNECGQAGKPAIHLNVMEIINWIEHIIEQYAPPKTCFMFRTDPSIPDALGDEIKVFKDDDEIETALGSNQLSNEFCIEDTTDGDTFEFRNSGEDNVS